MRISLNWLKKYVNINVTNDELIRLIGARLVEVEGVIDETHKYDKIYVVRVASAEKIPDTHLTLCKIDAGEAPRDLKNVECDENGFVQVMCGAPNVREGMLAAWIAPGAVVPASVHEDAPFVIGKRKMLGKYDSYGMLAGADELDFGDDHTGIAEIDPDEAEPGQAIAEVFELDDLILEIENKSLTHRPDCFGIIGFAREVAGILGEKFDAPMVQDNFKIDNEIKIEIADAQICPRYVAMVFEKHGELKKKYLTWQDTILAKSGMRPVDRVVDATNYLMLLTGQPLHAFDYDKFVAVGGGGNPKIIVRLARDGERLTLLDGKEVELCQDDIVITSNDVPVALAGAMGGLATAIDESTRNIILESATFSLYNLRKTQMAHGIFSEAITRFTKGQPPYQCMMVAGEFAGMVIDGFKIKTISDKYLVREKEIIVKVTVGDINELMGTNYDEKMIVRTLENVGFTVKSRHGNMEVHVPAWRTDIHIKEDIIEEVGRLNGYDNIVPTLPRHKTAGRNALWELKTTVRNTLKSYGANELLTYSFVSEKLLKKAGLETTNSYKIVNSISPELQYVRQSIVPSLLEKAYMNQKLPVDKLAIFEINKVYQKEWGMDAENVPVEKMRLGFVIAERKGTGDAYYAAKNYAVKLLEELNILVKFLPLKSKEALALPFEPKRAAEIWVDDTCIGVVGEFKNSVRRNFKLAEYLAGFEIDMMEMLRLSGKKVVSGNFTIRDKQDITITTTKDYADVYDELLAKYSDADILPVGIYQPKGVREKNVTFHLEFR
ncbi:phenylalanine--tRNA ligase subunit beta [Candidatus Saccharibacteria bacterium]|nr:phenylalanine--tRNA ligase subunit beta [Candidatus Saccharibacteria bacterium]